MGQYVTARTEDILPEGAVRALFQSRVIGACDAAFLGSERAHAIGACGLPYKAPVLKELLRKESFRALWKGLKDSGESCLLRLETGNRLSAFKTEGKAVVDFPLAASLTGEILAVLTAAERWGGTLNGDGEHVIDLKSPSPGPHFFVNLLMGNRMGFDYPLQTTPKSVVDRYGRGSFRSHAATQVLATRWDLRQEENGFPCNRQFYLTEGSKRVFYSADAESATVNEAACVHGQNHTRISYSTACGLGVERTIFLPMQEAGLPLAVEIQRIAVTNRGTSARRLRMAYTGMFGPSKPPALQEDVLYSNIIMEAGILLNKDGTVRAVSPRYFPLHDQDDLRFHAMVVRAPGGNAYPNEYCLNYNDFVGRGTLESPDGLFAFPNELYRKGPGFFAVAAEFAVNPGETVFVDHFTGLVSKRANPSFDSGSLSREIDALLGRFESPESVPLALGKSSDFLKDYAAFFQLRTGDPGFSTYCNRNLPFQVLYQTFVSRSFDQTQKGYREIGFREIQDLFASMYYFNARGNGDFVKRLLTEWVSQVHEFGFANHNFFWEGKEAGHWSDDALWLHQAVGRYVHLTGDAAFLDAAVPVAGADGKRRTVFETLLACLRYSTEISVGPHGIPLLDRADWNDCLRLDRNYRSGSEKEKIYRETGRMESNNTESVMNAFLAIIAAKETRSLAGLRGDTAAADKLDTLIARLSEAVRAHAWKGNAYARLLFNDYPGFTYAGADGDGLDTDGSGGTLFLNSFSWSVLAGVADEAQVRSMLEAVRRKLKTPHGLKLVSPNDLSRVVRDAASAEYFPGDRENGAVFKHASMMAVSALLDAAKRVENGGLAAELAAEAWSMIDLVYPGRAMENPFVLAGNPRFCTQYNNSETGENIGPLLSGTSTWFILSLMKAYGIELSDRGLIMDPVLRREDTQAELRLRMGDADLLVRYEKPSGFRRVKDAPFELSFDGAPQDGNAIPLPLSPGSHEVRITFR